MFRIAVCDDEINICNSLENAILSMTGEMNLTTDIEVFFSGSSLLRSIREGLRFDLIFLDIEMDDGNGIEVSEKLRNELSDIHTEIVYVTCTTQYDRKLFDYHPLAFIPKPFDNQAVQRAISLALKRKNVISPMFGFTVNRQHIQIPYQEILYFESDDRKIKIVTEKETYSYYDKMSAVLQKLPPMFCRIHRSYIINLHQIAQYGTGEITMKNRHRIAIGRNYRETFLQAQLDLLERL